MSGRAEPTPSLWWADRREVDQFDPLTGVAESPDDVRLAGLSAEGTPVYLRDGGGVARRDGSNLHRGFSDARSALRYKT